MEYVTTRLIHKISKHKEMEPQGEDVAMVARHSKAGDPRLRQRMKTCFCWGKTGHIARFQCNPQRNNTSYLLMPHIQPTSHKSYVKELILIINTI